MRVPAILIACLLPPAATAAAAPAIAIDVVAQEAAFERRAAAIGIVPAFRETVAPDAIMFLPHPVRIAERLDGAEWSGRLRWRPAFIAASRDGSMALSIGPSRWDTGKGAELGYYVTIWQRDSDHRLRFVLDRGTVMPRDLHALPATPPETQIATGPAAAGDTIATVEAALARDAATDLSAALSSRLDPRGRILRDGHDPAIGPAAARRLLSTGPAAIQYDPPMLVRASPDGDLAYAYGKAQWTTPGQAAAGYWVRVWQRRDGSQTLILDHLQPLPEDPPPAQRRERSLRQAVSLLGRRAWSWRSRDEPGPYGFLPFQRKDHTIKAWDQTPSPPLSHAPRPPPRPRSRTRVCWRFGRRDHGAA